MLRNQDNLKSEEGLTNEQVTNNSAKHDTRPLKGCDLTHKCSLRGIPKDHLVEKFGVSKKNLGGWSNFFKGSGLSVAPKPKCVITQPISRMAFYDVLTSSSSSPSTTISLALVSF